MGTAFTPDALRGILIPDPRIVPSSPALASSYTQADPAPGVPDPTATTALTLETSGSQTNGTTIEVECTRSGGAITTDSVRAGGFAWRETGAYWQGWDGPLGYAGWDTVHTWATGAGADLYTYPHVMFTRDGTRLVVAQKTVAAGSLQTLVVFRRSLAGATSTSTIVTNAITAQALHACIVETPDRLVLLVTYDDLPSVGVQVRAYASIDDGQVWDLQTTACLPAYIDTSTTTVRRLRAAYHAGQVLLVLGVRVPTATIDDTLWQYASIDGGFSFTLVEKVDASDADSVHVGGVQDLYVIPDVGFGMVYCGSSRNTYGANSETLAKRLGSAFQRMTEVEPVEVGLLQPAGNLTVGGALSDDTELCAALDDDGAIYAFAPNTGNSSRVRPAKSLDGVTWSVLGQAANLVHSIDYAGERPASMTCAWYGGACHLVHAVDSTTTYDAQLGVAVLSGYTAAPLPMLPAVQSGGDYSAGSYMTWAPYWDPSTLGWTTVTVGVPTTTLTGGAMQISAAVGEVRAYVHTRAVALTTAHTVQACFEVDCDSGVTTHTTMVAGTGVNTYKLRIRVTTTQVVIIDFVSGVTKMTYNRTAGQYIHVRAWLTNNAGTGKATVAVDEVDGPYGISRGYYRVIDDNSMTDAGAAAAEQSVSIGQTGQGVSNWRYCATQYSSQMGDPHGLTIPEELNGRDFSSRPLTLSQGLRVRAIGGPAALGDLWYIAARFGHGVDALASTSPSVTWRSTDTVSPQVFIWETDSTIANVSPLMGPIGALFIGGANFRTATLEGRNSTGGWVSIGTWDAASGQTGLAWDRRSNIVYPRSSAASSGVYWYPHGIMDGARFMFDTAAGPVRAIEYQTEGAWTNAATKHARLSLFGQMGGVGANGTAGAILSTSGVLLWNNDPQYSAYRLTIPVQFVAESYYEMGVVMLGHLAAFGRRYSWGRSLTSEPNVELRTGSNGRRTSQVLGPTRRGVEFGWSDAADQSAFGVDQTGTTPDFFYGSSTGTPDPAAAAMDGPALMRGIVEHVEGANTPVVYLAYAPRVQLGTAQMVVHPDLHLYGRIVSDVSVETVQGKEWDGTGATGEMVRTSSLRIEEEL